MNELVILIGNIGCGKTTLAREYVNKGYVSVARDYLRYAIGSGVYTYKSKYESAIWAIEMGLFEEFLHMKVNIVVDAVNLSKELRSRYISMAKEYDYKIICRKLPRFGMKEAVDNRMKDPHQTPDRKLWEKAYNKFNRQYEEPTFEEGFDEIVNVYEGGKAL